MPDAVARHDRTATPVALALVARSYPPAGLGGGRPGCATDPGQHREQEADDGAGEKPDQNRKDQGHAVRGERARKVVYAACDGLLPMSRVPVALAWSGVPRLSLIVAERPGQTEETSGDGACTKEEVAQIASNDAALSIAHSHEAVSAVSSQH